MSLSKKKKQKLISNSMAKKCNKLMNDSCSNVKKEVNNAKQKFVKFVKFPDNMGSQIIFMNIKKVQNNPSSIRKSL